MRAPRELRWNRGGTNAHWFGAVEASGQFWGSTWQFPQGATTRFVTSLAAMTTLVVDGELHISAGSAPGFATPPIVAKLGPGDALLSLGQVTYGIECTQEARVLLTDLSFGGCPANPLRITRNIPLEVENPLQRLVESSFRKSQSNDSTSEVGVDSWVQLSQAVQRRDLFRDSETINLNRSHSSALMGAIKQRVDQQFRTQITMRALASQFAVSSSYLSRNFRKEFGQSPNQYLYALRREAFLRSLVLGHGSLSMRAAAAGFTDYVNLCHRFRRELGNSPSLLGNWSF